MEKYLVTLLVIMFTLPGQSIQERAAPTKSPTTSWQATDFPDPQKDPAACGVPYLSSSNVCNPNLIVNNYTVAIIERLITRTFNNTPEACDEESTEGFRVSVAFIDDIQNTDGFSAAQQREVADKFASILRNGSWQYGTCENNVVIVVSRTGKTIGASFGSKARSRLPKNITQRLLDDAISRINPNVTGVETMWLVAQFYDHLTDAYEMWTIYRIFAIVIGSILAAAAALLLMWLVAYCCVYAGDRSRKKVAKLAKYRAHLLRK